MVNIKFKTSDGKEHTVIKTLETLQEYIDYLNTTDRTDITIEYSLKELMTIQTEGTTNTPVIRVTNSISAEEFLTRTNTFDKTKGNALDFIKDSDELKTKGKIDHKKFPEYKKAGKDDVVSLSDQVSKHEQAIYELKMALEGLKSKK